MAAPTIDPSLSSLNKQIQSNKDKSKKRTTKNLLCFQSSYDCGTIATSTILSLAMYTAPAVFTFFLEKVNRRVNRDRAQPALGWLSNEVALTGLGLRCIGRPQTAFVRSTKSCLHFSPDEKPRPLKAVEDEIISLFTDKLKSLPNLFKKEKGQGPVEEERKKNVRAQLEIGVGCVFRSLERGDLACLLVSGQATPAVTVGHVIALAREKACPVMCLDSLATSIAATTASNCFPLAIGFKNILKDSTSDFCDVIACIKKNVPAQDESHDKSQETNNNLCKDTPTLTLTSSTTKNSQSVIRINKDSETQALDVLKRTFSSAVVNSPTEDTKSKERKKHKQKKKKKRNNLKENIKTALHSEFEVGKRCVLHMLERGKLGLILVSQELLPVLSGEPSPCLLSVAAERKCPILCLPGMGVELRPLLGGLVSVLGFKKFSSLPADTSPHFKTVVETCLSLSQSSESHGVTSSPSLVHKSQAELDASLKKNLDHSSLKSNTEEASEEDEEEEEDYSYLYVLKKDSKELEERIGQQKARAAAAAENLSFSSDFISLSGSQVSLASTTPACKEEQIGQKKGGVGGKRKVSGSAAEVDGTQGTSEVKKVKLSVEEERANKNKSSQAQQDNVMSFSVTRTGNKEYKGIPQNTGPVFYSQPIAEVVGQQTLSSTKNKNVEESTIPFLSLSKKGQKKAKKKSHSQEGFMPFAYVETKVRTMVANPNKKKKKKKKKS